jgi:hypothetical protein
MGTLGVFVNLRKTTIRFAIRPSVRLSAWNKWTYVGQKFLKLLTEFLFDNLLTKFNFNFNMIRITGTLHADVCTVVIMTGSVLLTINVSEKVCSENRNTHFIFIAFQENRYCYGIMFENMAFPHM